MSTLPIPAAVALRAATRFEVNTSGCHVSTYSTGSHGYAQIGWWANGKSHMTTAHRAAFKHFTGSEPESVDHRPECDRRCVRQEHLRALPLSENARRNGPDRDYPIGWTCRRNHNLPRDLDGECPECKRGHGRRHRDKVAARKEAA